MALLVESFSTRPIRSISELLRTNRRMTALGVLALTLVSLFLAVAMLVFGPTGYVFVWLFYLAGLATCLVQPRYGVYLIVGLTLVGDWIMWPQWPFMKNFSSIESWLYLHDAVIISPLESYLVAALVSWLVQGLARRQLDMRWGPVALPMAVFLGFVGLMSAYGVARGGANINVLLWETRPLAYLALMFVLATNLIRTRHHVVVLLWTLAVSLWLRGMSGVAYVGAVLGWNTEGLERIGNHAMSIFFDSIFILTIGAFMFRASWKKRVLLLLMLPPMLFSFFSNQRRASFVALGIGLLVIAIALYVIRRRLFWKIAPPALLIGVIYLGVFWNSGHPLAFGASSFRSVIGMGDERDSKSNQYRDIENANIMFTIRSAPQGVGFGQKFYIIYPLPDISFFEWWEYITHNAVLYMWMKAGPFGFMAMLSMFGVALATGGRAIVTMPDGVLRIAALTLTTYLIMHFVYTYVDMAWDTQSMVYVGTAMGVLGVLSRIAETELVVKAPRWPWQSPVTVDP